MQRRLRLVLGRIGTTLGAALGLVLAVAVVVAMGFTSHALATDGAADQRERDPDIGKSYKVPYRLTNTNHFLVRVRLNGKGPFNFLVDTGAPALYVSTETAKKIGLQPNDEEFWTPLERLDFEGGARLRNVKARVEDPFQLVGMNALGLPGASIDGILGFTMLARFRLELDPTQDRMVWTRLDFEPKEPFVPRRKEDRGAGKGSVELQAMNALGPIAKVAAALIGKQPEDQLIPRGYLGLELEPVEQPGKGLRISRVLPGSPAASAGVLAGDGLLRLAGRAVDGLDDARGAVAKTKAGDRVPVAVRRGGETLDLTIRAGEGF